MRACEEADIVHIVAAGTLHAGHATSLCGLPLTVDYGLTDESVSAPNTNVIVCAECEAAQALEKIELSTEKGTDNND